MKAVPEKIISAAHRYKTVAPNSSRYYTSYMKNILLCGINARFSHSSLALLCLKHSAKQNIDTAEFTINDSVSSIVRGVTLKSPDAVGFSCYIWNIEYVLKAASSIKKLLPDCFILLGGPEVSYDGEQLMREYPFIDMIIRGAGEIPFSYFTERFDCGDILTTTSACIRQGDRIVTTPCAPPYDLNETPFMYGDLKPFENKVIYYETSRGCPFRCAYCMSANEELSFLPIERVKAELEHFMKSGIMQVKLVDRTFNFPPGRAYEIIDTLIALSETYLYSKTNFHLEITASLLDGDTLALLIKAKKGLLRLEIGIQSTNPETLHAVNRSLDMQKLLDNTRALCGMGNIKVHADLIAGLPLESFDSFKTSFNDAYDLKPDELQLGFLKLLKGSPMRDMADRYGIVYTSYPPYEVLKTDDISFEEISTLHIIEQVLGSLYNSRLCLNALKRLIPSFVSPFNFFEQFSLYLDSKEYFSRPHKTKELFVELHSFAESRSLGCEALDEALLLDWLFLGKPRDYPSFLDSASESVLAQLRSFLGRPENIQRYLPEYVSLPPRETAKRCHIHTFRSLFPGKTLLLNYGRSRDDDGFCQTIE